MTTYERALPEDRAERALPDKKPTFSRAEAVAEAERCLYCSDAPCIQACPTEIDIPTFIKKIASGNVTGSAKTIFDQNLLGYSCARVCPVEVLCVGSCVYNAWDREPIAIGRLQRYATETATASLDVPILAPKAAPGTSGKRVACIGAGPASLAFAGYSALEGHKAVVFEKRPLPGGLNTTGIAPYKLHADDALHEVAWVTALGVEVKTGVEVGKDISAKELLEQFDAVYIGVGLGADSKLGVPGEDGGGVVGATAWIEEMKLRPRAETEHLVKGKRVIVVGGGNTAIDVARECALLGAAEVTMVYRRGAGDMSGYEHEMEAARLEGVRLVTYATPLWFHRDDAGALTGLVVRRAPPDAAPAEETIPCDLAALAIGQAKIREIAALFDGVTVDKRGCIQADPKTGATGNARVFAGGDCINGGKEVVNAVADGRNAARFLSSAWETKKGA